MYTERRATMTADPLGTARTMHEARAYAWKMPPRRLLRLERRLRRRHDRLAAEDLTQWYAARHVLRERGVTVPPLRRGMS